MHDCPLSGAVRTFRTCALVLLALTAPGRAEATAPAAAILSTPDARTVYSETATFKAWIAGDGPTGTVTFMDAGKTIGTGVVARSRDQFGVAAGDYHTCAVTPGGDVSCWGGNAFRQLGDGTTTPSDVPVPVVGLPSGIVAISAGGWHTCALTKAGAVWCWGYGMSGQLGNGAFSESAAPGLVTGLASGIVAIASGREHTCALSATGGLKCWGYNGGGNLGIGTLANHNTPVQVEGLASGVAAVSAGLSTTCALTDVGGVLCWGQNNAGQVGDGTTTTRTTPVPVTGLSSGIADITSTKEATNCALTDAGGVKCWGYNGYGQLGIGSVTGESLVPVQVSGLASGVFAVEGGRRQTCAVTKAGAALCWGLNTYGQVGDGTKTNRYLPTPVSGLSSGVAAINPGADHTCAVTDSGAVLCWGFNGYGQLGNGTEDDSLTPVAVTDFAAGTAMVAGEASFSTGTFDAGRHVLTARYNGDGANAASTSHALVHTVDKAKTRTTFKVKPKKPKAGRSASLKIAVEAVEPATAKPDGTAAVKGGRKKLGKVKVKKGKAGLRTPALKAGKHKFKVTYKGDANWQGSKASATVAVK
jgi:alpha-tubulin suppressor-like RCC1 family protein